MRLFLILLLTPMIAEPACVSEFTVNKHVNQLKDLTRYIEKNSAKRAVPAKKLAPVILRLSKKYNVDAKLIANVMLLESRGIATVVNGRDTGLMQIRDVHGLSSKCLLTWECNLEYGVRYLAQTSRPCQYNLGLNRNLTIYNKACLRYEANLAAIN